jgi:AraC-like DNA-binding protein
MPLGGRPRIVNMGNAVHGVPPVDAFNVNFWTLHLYGYSADLVMGEQAYPICFGHMGINAPGRWHEYRYHQRECPHLYVHFTCEPGDMTESVPVMVDMSSEYQEARRAMDEMLGLYARSSLRAEIRLWDLLWGLADRYAAGTGRGGTLHPAVRRSMEHVEQHLGEPLRALEVARYTGFSLNHLNRLFGAATGRTVKEHITARRMERARHLLVNTSRPVKAIAWECGIRDPQLFNKTVRKRLGAAPSAVRSRRR